MRIFVISDHKLGRQSLFCPIWCGYYLGPSAPPLCRPIGGGHAQRADSGGCEGHGAPLLLRPLQQAVQGGHGVRGAPVVLRSRTQEGGEAGGAGGAASWVDFRRCVNECGTTRW